MFANWQVSTYNIDNVRGLHLSVSVEVHWTRNTGINAAAVI